MEAYRLAGDKDSMARLLLDRLGEVDKAMQLVRETKSSVAAGYVAAHCRTYAKWKEAVEFGVMAGENEIAYEEALVHGCMDVYVQLRKDEGRKGGWVLVDKAH